MPETKRNRFNSLTECLQYCSENRYTIFTSGERICINQERGALLSYEHEQDFILQSATVFKHSIELNNKIEAIITEIKNSHWRPANIINVSCHNT